MARSSLYSIVCISCPVIIKGSLLLCAKVLTRHASNTDKIILDQLNIFIKLIKQMIRLGIVLHLSSEQHFLLMFEDT
jgi:hypothetical protein